MATYKPLYRTSTSPKTVNGRGTIDEKELRNAMGFHLGQFIPQISKTIDREGIVNIVKQSMQLYLPEIIADSLLNNNPIMESDLNELISNLPPGSGNYQVGDIQGLGTFLERLVFGFPIDAKPFADFNFYEILYRTMFDLRVSNEDFKEIYDDIENVILSKYMQTVKNMNRMGGKSNEEHMGFEGKAKSSVNSGIDVGGFPIEDLLGKDGYFIIAEGIRKIYYKMSTLFLLSISYDTATGANQKELVFRGASIFHELIYDEIIRHIVGGGLRIRERNKNPAKGLSSYSISIDFSAANTTFKTIGNNVIEQVRATGLYAHEINLWDESSGSRKQFFTDVVKLMKDRGLLTDGVKLKWEWQK